jgi:alkylation response protein AidB-like acyl-CoA dehydrogenase
MKAACEKDAGMDIAHSELYKLYASEIALEVANEVQIHGGNGLMWQLT